MHFQLVIGLLWISVVILEAFRSEVVRGYPCIRRNNQVYCPTPGSKLLKISRNRNNTSVQVTTPYIPSDTSSSLDIPKATESSESDKAGTESTRAPAVTTTSTYFMYYTKQSLTEPNADDNSLHEYKSADVVDNIIDDRDQVLTRVNRERIETYIDENKALIRRMLGENHAPDDGLHSEAARDHYTSYSYGTGSSDSSSNSDSNGQAIHKRPKRAKTNSYTNNKIDSCESAVEIVTPYWASNSAGKIRAIVNTQHLQQAIQQEVCQSVQTKRCNNDCSCEQKYKWHRLLAYDPDDDCKGIFMDWFLFPSCCVCRCSVL